MHHPSDACCGRIPIEFPIKPTAPPLPTTAISCLGASRTPAVGARGWRRHAGVRETCTQPDRRRVVAAAPRCRTSLARSAARVYASLDPASHRATTRRKAADDSRSCLSKSSNIAPSACRTLTARMFYAQADQRPAPFAHLLGGERLEYALDYVLTGSSAPTFNRGGTQPFRC